METTPGAALREALAMATAIADAYFNEKKKEDK